MSEPIGTTSGANPGGTPRTTSKPLPGVTDLDVKLNNKAFIYFVDFVLPKIAGAKGWWEKCAWTHSPTWRLHCLMRHLLYFAAKTCGISGMQMASPLQAIMTKEKTPAVGPTGNMVAGWNKACNGSMSSSRRPSSIEARNGHQPLRAQSWISLHYALWRNKVKKEKSLEEEIMS